MITAKRLGRVIGVMLLLQLVGLILPFVLIQPLTSADYFQTASSYSFQIKAAVLLFFANGALTIGISIVAFRVFRKYSEMMAIWLIVLSVIMFVMQAVDNVYVMSMLSLSEQYANLPAPSNEAFSALAAVVRATRRAAHYTELFAIDFWLMMFGAILLRFDLVPRMLAAFGLLTIALHFAAVPLLGLLGYGIYTQLGVPMAFGILANALWLIVQGFGDRRTHEAVGVK